MAAYKKHLRDAQTVKAGSGVFKLCKRSGIVCCASGACRGDFVDIVSGVVLAVSARGMYSAAGLTMQIFVADATMQTAMQITAADATMQIVVVDALMKRAAVGLTTKVRWLDRRFRQLRLV